MNPLTRNPHWQTLSEHRARLSASTLNALFERDAGRFERYSCEAAGLFLDYSKQLIDADTLAALLALADSRGLAQRRAAMFAGERINATEDRAVLHVALRHPGPGPMMVDGRDVLAEVRRVHAQMRGFAERVRAGTWRGGDGAPITDVVNIGIGGSDLGPLMVCEALRSYGHGRLTMHFVSNVDGAHLAETLKRLRPQTTLFVVASKTFTTTETLTNAHSARAWFLRSGGREDQVAKHFVAVSTNAAAVAAFGIDTANMFEFWDWVGGRYSLWSAIGLPIAIYAGMDAFEQLLAGAHAMDRHFLEAAPAQNMPVLLGLLGIWNTDFLGATSHCIAPYAQALHRLPAYLQQLEMESNGKSVTLDGAPVGCATSPVIWGEPGTNAQHAYFQMLHQGTGIVPVDFIATLAPGHGLPDHHVRLLSNCYAQSQALMRGKPADEVRAEMHAHGVAAERIEALLPHRVFAGNRPSSTVLLPALDPHTLGALLALYEHKVFVQGVVWGINSFDQWGVELGKQLARTIEGDLRTGTVSAAHDASTRGLLARTLAARGSGAA